MCVSCFSVGVGVNSRCIEQPQAIRSALDVYGENARKVIPIESPQFGRVMVVCVGAMMVGSIHTTVHEEQHVTRGQELGYFAFGGCLILVCVEASWGVDTNICRWVDDRGVV